MDFRMSMDGIDISSHQTGIDLHIVPCDFVIIKATQGIGYVNPDCDRAYQQAKQAGKCLGVYHYAGGGAAKAEAKYFLHHIKGYIGEAVLCLDWEKEQNERFGEDDFEWCRTWLDYVAERTGVKPLLYTSQAYMDKFADIGDYGLWIAQYADNKATGYQQNPWNEGAYLCAVRQYSSHGCLDGYSGNLDLNKFYGDRMAWEKYAGKSYVVKPESSETISSEGVAPEGSICNTNQSDSEIYIVKEGDSLSAIAAKYRTTYQKIAEDNGIMQPDLIYPGQRLLIKRDGFRGSNQQYYKICPGDTLDGIAARFGRSREELQMWNNIGNPNYILAGDTIRVG